MEYSMPQLHCYVPESLAKQVQEKANQAHLSSSKYLAMLIKKDIDNQWPESYFDLYGSWEGEAIQRPHQDVPEERDGLL
jgi:hypothetical protein